MTIASERPSDADVAAARALAIIESMAGAAAWATDVQGRFTYISPGASAFIGATVEDLNASLVDGVIGWSRVVHADDFERVATVWRHCVQTGDDFDIELRMRRADGVHLWFRCTGRPARDKRRKIVGWHGTTFNIDDLKRTAERLRERERAFSQLVDMVPSHLWRLAPDGEPVFFNKRMVDFLGLDVADTEKAGMTRLEAMIAAAIHADDAVAFSAALNRSLATGEHFAMRYRLRRHDGVYRWMSSRAEPIQDEFGAVVQWYGLCHDIDDQMRADDALRRSEQQLKQMIDAVPALIWCTTPEGIPCYLNRRTAESTGVSLADVAPGGARDLSAVIHPDDRDATDQALTHSFQTGTPYVGRYRQRRADGSYRWVEGRAEPLRDDAGNIVQWYGVSVDIHDLIVAEAALRERERELLLLVDMVPVNIARMSPDGEPTFYSKRALESIGMARLGDWDREDVTRLDVMTSTIHPDDAPQMKQILTDALASGVAYTHRYRRRWGDGVWRWMEGRAEPLRDESGQIVQWYGVAIDIDNQMRVQEALRGLAEAAIALHACQSVEAVMQTVTDRARDIIGAHMAMIGTTTDQNWTQAILGVSLSDKLAGYRDFSVKPHGAGIYALVCESNRPMRLTQAELEAHPAWRGFGEHADEHPPLRGWLAAPLIDSNGRNMGMLQISDKYDGDFTEDDEGIAMQLAQMASLAISEARLHESLASSRKHLQELIDAVPVRIWSATSTEGPLYFNKRYQDYLRGVVTDFDSIQSPTIETFLSELVHAEDAPQVLDTFRACFDTGSSGLMRFRWREKDGAYRWAECRLEPRRDEDGAIAQWYGVSLDIDDEVRAQEGLRHASEKLARATQVASMAELSASIAHEVNQPLAAIVANSHACERWLSSDAPNIERARLTVERIIRDANSAADVVSRIRALFRQSVEVRTRAPIDLVIADARELMAEEAARRGIRLDVHVEGGLPDIVFDRVQLQQVLINLMRNGMEAMDAMQGRRSLGVRVRRAGEAIEVAIIDRGSGVSHPDKVFEPFFTTKQGGMGMGLAICRSIIERHGGRLWTEANEPTGAMFIFALPLPSSAAAEE